MKRINLFWLYFLVFTYLEIVYKFLVNDYNLKLSVINMFLFITFLSFIMVIVTNLFKSEKKNKIIFIIFLLIFTLWFIASYVLKSYFGLNLTITSFKLTDQIVEFAYQGLLEILKRIIGIILLFIPFILCIIFKNNFDFERKKISINLLIITMGLLTYGLNILFLNLSKDSYYSAYNLYYNLNNISLNVENFGVINSFFIDVKRNILGFKENIVIIEKEEEEIIDEEIEYEYNNLDIDFDNLIKNTDDETLKKMHEYFKNESGTLKNEYTGIFKNKNLILFMAESFNEIAVSPEITPTLYKLVNNGFVFENFYSPTIYSTIGGEFQELTSLYPESIDTLYKFRSGDIEFNQGVAYKFKELGYDTFAYHNNSYQFQNRDKYLKSLGFDNFKACYNGLEKLINCKKWPQSDREMIEATVNDYINKDNFMVFYATVSGHEPYVWNNASSKAHEEEYLSYGLDYSIGPSSYLAAQMELDQALELLIKKLEENNRLDDTVIALVGDHYPYELSIDEINEISKYKKEEKISVSKSNFIFWNNKMDKVNVSKVGSQIDVMPTIYNAFGIDYDSRIIIGKDILSSNENIAIFGDYSWVTDKGMYYASKQEFIPKDNNKISDSYVNDINRIVNNKITMSKLIIDKNYYKYLKK